MNRKRQKEKGENNLKDSSAAYVMTDSHDTTTTVHTATGFVTGGNLATSLPGDKACTSITSCSAS